MYDASVLIPTYNRSNLLELTLASFLRQDLRDFTYEIVIVDDGSEDDTKDIIDKYSKLLNIKYLYHEHNGIALSKTRNEGILCSLKLYAMLLQNKYMFDRNINKHRGRIKYEYKCSYIRFMYYQG